MRKVFCTAVALTFAAAPASAQQVEKSSFAPAAEAAAPAQPRAAADEPAPSIHVTRQRVDETVREQEQRRAAVTLDRNFWYLVGAVALGVIIASVII